MAFDNTKSYEVENGVTLTEGGSGLFADTADPTVEAEAGSLVLRDNAKQYVKHTAGTGADKYQLLQVLDDSVDASETLYVPSGKQFISAATLTVNGDLNISGKLVVI